jgi:hypothetical protein
LRALSNLGEFKLALGILSILDGTCGESFVSGGEGQQKLCARPILFLKISERDASADLIIELTTGRTWPKFYSASHIFPLKSLGWNEGYHDTMG